VSKPLIVLGLFSAAVLAASAACARVYDHIVVVVEENQSLENILHDPEMPYVNGTLVPNAALLTNSHGTEHDSQPNYLDLFAGNPQGVGAKFLGKPDSVRVGTTSKFVVRVSQGHTQRGSNHPVPGTPLTTPNLGAALIAAGKSFAGYSEDLPANGSLAISNVGPKGSGIDYERKHSPWTNWQAADDRRLGRNQLPSTTNLTFDMFPGQPGNPFRNAARPDYSSLPTVAFVIPNQINDGHGYSSALPNANLSRATDEFLRKHLERYRQWAMSHNSLLIVTWDEDDDSYTPVKDAQGKLVGKKFLNLIPTIIAGEGVVPGKYDRFVDHCGVLRTILAAVGQGPLSTDGSTCDADAEIFAAPFAGRLR
jgi:phosphatidylinositol-3-phosphatase